jgi:Tfp pilus assembly protein PilX
MRKLIRLQNGIAMPLVMGMLLIVSIAAGAVAATSMTASDQATGDRNAKRALAAAEAGLQVANLRLNNRLGLGASQCLVGTPSGIECPTSGAGDLGNGATYQYWVSQQLAAGDACGSVPTQTQTGRERCITAQGIVEDVKRRVQTRVLDLPTISSLLPIPGVVGLNRIRLLNDSQFEGRAGSNGQISASGDLTVQGIDLGPAGSASGSIDYTQAPPSPVVHAEPLTLTAVPVGDTATINQNAWLVGASGATYTAADRSLRVTGTLTLTQSGDYNLCKLDFQGGSIRLAAGVSARIFVDAPDAARPGSGCPSGNGWGEINANNSVSMNPGGDPANFQLFVVGWDPASTYGQSQGRATVTFLNQLTLNGLLYAPNAAVNLQNDTTVTGGIAAYDLVANNKLNFVWDPAAAEWDDTRVHYALQGWRECRPEAPTPGDPESGC